MVVEVIFSTLICYFEILKILLVSFYLMDVGCHACIYVCAQRVSLVPVEPRTGASARTVLTAKPMAHTVAISR